MSDADTVERPTMGREKGSLPIAARQRLWDAVWERLLAPVSEEFRHRPGQVRLRGDDDRQPRVPSADQPDGEAA